MSKPKKLNNIEITQEIIKTFNFSNYKMGEPSTFIKECWEEYTTTYKSNQSLNGAIFENLIAYILAYEGIEYIYEQAEIAFVPNAIFDILFYNPDQPYTLSLKTTLRERWKQADLEAYALKNVLKNAKSYVITLSEKEVKTRRNKFDKKEDFYNGLDGFILANTNEFDELVHKLKKIRFQQGDMVSIVKANDRYNGIEEYNHKYDL